MPPSFVEFESIPSRAEIFVAVTVAAVIPVVGFDAVGAAAVLTLAAVVESVVFCASDNSDIR